MYLIYIKTNNANAGVECKEVKHTGVRMSSIIGKHKIQNQKNFKMAT